MGSEATAAADNQAAIRRDPMAMLPFCGYNMADYWRHWLEMGRAQPNPPKIFRVNWFRKDADGKFIWPGFGENLRVIKWIVDRVNGQAEGVDHPLGITPRYEDINWTGLDFAQTAFDELMTFTKEAGMAEVREQAEYFSRFGGRLPSEFTVQREQLATRIMSGPEIWRTAS